MAHNKRLVATMLVICTLFIVLHAFADEDIYFIICNTKSYVVVRRSPNKKSEEAGRLDCGDWFKSDGKKKNGYLHVIGITEYGEGWIYEGYVVDEEPDMRMCVGVIAATGRVMSWRTMNGGKKGWIKVGTQVEVYAMTKEWAATSKGFVRTKYLEVWYE